MIENKQYTVQFEDVPETEQLIFKLIFSISEKARGRIYHYRIDNDIELGNADIIVKSMSSAGDDKKPSEKIWLVDRGISSDDCTFHIQRPLIATRVLMVLDRYVVHLLDNQMTMREIEATVEEEIVTDTDDQTAIEFCITEEEASELAIVADETLSNPANESIETIKSDTDINSALNVQPESTLVAFQRSTNESIAIRDGAVDTVSALKKSRAIVVDDSASVRKQIELELDLFDVDVDYAESVEQTFDLLGKNSYDVAFLDVVLPDGDGFQICKSIRQTSKEMKVIMLTGKATAADKIKGTMVGCDAYLVKPVGRMTFQNAVCQYLKLNEQHEAMNA